MKLDVKITKLAPADRGVRAYASATLDGCFAIRGMKLVEGKKGLFVSMPTYQKRDNSYADVCFPTTAEFREQLNNAVVEAYQQYLAQHLNQNQQSAPFAAVEQSNGSPAPTMGMSM